MQVNSTKVQPKFIPIKVEITFENQQEFDLFKSLMGHNCSVPEYLHSGHSDEKALSAIMAKVYNSMYDIEPQG